MKSTARALVALALFTVLFATPSPAHAASPGFVIVNYGDTLYSIAMRNGTTVDALVQANGLPSSTFVLVGQRLVIPSGNSVPAPISAPAGSGMYVISAGDTVRNIAARFGITVDALAHTGKVAQHLGKDDQAVEPLLVHQIKDDPRRSFDRNRGIQARSHETKDIRIVGTRRMNDAGPSYGRIGVAQPGG